jgi:hypothetical protein
MKKKERVINHVLKADKHLPLFISAFKVGERIRSEKKYLVQLSINQVNVNEQ